MAQTCDILVIGGGVAGLSAAAAIAPGMRVRVLEAESQIGFHASGRSATMFHYALGDELVRSLTKASRSLFDDPPEGFTDVALGKRMPILVHARADEVEALEMEERELAPFAAFEWLDERGLSELCPILRIGDGGAVRGLVDHDCLRIDQHALLQGYLRMLRKAGGELLTGARVASIARDGLNWTVTTEAGDAHEAPVVVNAAGAWADHIAILAGLAPIGLQPMRRTIITFEAPQEVRLDTLPFTKTVGNELYFAPESGRLFASPMDEVPSDACDAQPGEYEIALAAHRMGERTTVEVRHIHSKWSGLRSFAPDRHPVAGFAPDGDGFFWLAGQGGFGLQTSPAMAAITASLICGDAWPVAEISPADLSPSRFVRKSA
ncbi:MAG TPA: FAD-dependent oxidoreductase [Sphingomicrobium sp.]|nr:FAD-dependent oxidoreductase [Sphingomicrobium sp.]